MIGYKMGSALLEIYTMVKTSLVETKDFSSDTLQAWAKNRHGYQHGNAFCQGKFLKDQPQTLGQETWPLEDSNFKPFVVFIFTSYPPYQPLPQPTFLELKFLIDRCTFSPNTLLNFRNIQAPLKLIIFCPSCQRATVVVFTNFINTWKCALVIQIHERQ